MVFCTSISFCGKVLDYNQCSLQWTLTNIIQKCSQTGRRLVKITSNKLESEVTTMCKTISELLSLQMPLGSQKKSPACYLYACANLRQANLTRYCWQSQSADSNFHIPSVARFSPQLHLHILTRLWLSHPRALVWERYPSFMVP